MSVICGIFDVDREYAVRFANYIREKEGMLFEVMVFTTREAITEYTCQNVLDVLIVSGDVETKNIGEGIGNIIVLSENKDVRANEVYRYQPAKIMLEKVKSLIGQMPIKSSGKNASVIGVYTLGNEQDRSIFALNMAYELAVNKRVIYINTDTFSGLGRILDLQQEKNLSDTMYDYLEKGEEIADNIKLYVEQFRGVDILQSARCPEDLEEVNVGKYMEFVNDVVACGLYDVIVLDIGNIMKEQWKIIGLCHRLFMIMAEGAVSELRLNEFEMYMEKRNGSRIQELITVSNLPLDNSLKTQVTLLYQGESNVIRGHIRRLLSE